MPQEMSNVQTRDTSRSWVLTITTWLGTVVGCSLTDKQDQNNHEKELQKILELFVNTQHNCYITKWSFMIPSHTANELSFI